MIIFLGIAGAGKTEQSKLLADELGYNRISVGELLRKTNDISVKEKMNTGELIDDDTVIAIVEEAIENISSNREFIIDGFPRTLIEATWIANRQKGSVKVFQIILNSSEAIVRLKLRNRPDDNDRAVAKRIEEYEDLIKSILGVFRQKNITIFEIDGSKSIDNVHMQVVGYIKQQEGKVA